MKKVQVKLSRDSYVIEFSSLAASGDWARKILSPAAQKIVIVSNRKVFGLYGAILEKSFQDAGFEVFTQLIGDGEKYKSLRVLEETLRGFSEKKLTRTDAVVALGGGVVGDLTGFAAAVYLRGIPFLQIPTTLLAMIDSAVGGKTGVNTSFGKNLIGAFHQPKGVLMDVQTLRTLPRRELTAGFCEAVKQGAIAGADGELFMQTADFLKTYPVARFKTYFSNPIFEAELQKLLAAQTGFKARIVAGDEREEMGRSDANSRKILNFGHTTAHALEKVTGYKYFKHGEAVGYGILTAGEIAKTVANFDQNELKLLNDVVKLTGSLPPLDKIDIEEVIKAFSFDKKASGKTLQWILLEAIGKPKIVAGIPDSVIRNSLKKILKN